MINLNEFEKSDELLKRNSLTNIGFHLNLTLGKSLLGKNSGLTNKYGNYNSLRRLTGDLLLDRISHDAIYNEIKQQINSILKRGYHITHIDSHQNVHLFPPVMKQLLKVLDELSLDAPIRMPRIKIYTGINFLNLSFLRINLLAGLTQICKIRTNYSTSVKTLITDFFCKKNAATVYSKLIKKIHKGHYDVYEIVTHPGFPSKMLTQYDVYAEERLLELQFFKKNKILSNFKHIKLASFSDVFPIQE
jgi:predicted glycoside hydrolase/deacetylase ChbG (UPF0249 family)